MTDLSRAIEAFAKDVVTDAFDQAVEAATRAASKSERGIDKYPDVSDVKKQNDRDRAIAVAAAESAIASFFSNVELVGGTRVLIEVGLGQFLDIDEIIGAPITSFFFRDGWLSRYSKYSEQVALWQHE